MSQNLERQIPRTLQKREEKNLFQTLPLRLLNNFLLANTKRKKNASRKHVNIAVFLITNKNANLMMMYSNEGKMVEWMR